MSDFDKEAEREKLREKYEQEEDREATEQMSELLLKGATMTNAHCSDCGDPIFRYDGQEFCPTCEKPVDRGTNSDDQAGTDNVEVTAPSDDARVQFGGQEPSAEQPTDPAEQTADPAHTDDQSTPEHAEPGQTGTAADQQAEETTRSAPSLDPSADTRVDVPKPATSGEAAGAAGDVASSVASARASLARTADRFARAAEATEDPAVAREHLEAAREAAAALDELD